jgi:hypothetical protein
VLDHALLALATVGLTTLLTLLTLLTLHTNLSHPTNPANPTPANPASWAQIGLVNKELNRGLRRQRMAMRMLSISADVTPDVIDVLKSFPSLRVHLSFSLSGIITTAVTLSRIPHPLLSLPHLLAQIPCVAGPRDHQERHALHGSPSTCPSFRQ